MFFNPSFCWIFSAVLVSACDCAKKQKKQREEKKKSDTNLFRDAMDKEKGDNGEAPDDPDESFVVRVRQSQDFGPDIQISR